MREPVRRRARCRRRRDASPSRCSTAATRPSAVRAEEIARESGGNPLFLSELVRYSQVGVEPSERRPPGPDPSGEPVGVRAEPRGDPLDAHPPAARHGPTPPRGPGRGRTAVAGAARPTGRGPRKDEDEGSLALLFARHLVRARASDARDEIEPYHDQIRETAVASLSAETLRAHHRRLAAALEGSGTTDPEALALHFQEAGDADRAAEYASVAAARAADALAFERAARLYRLALELRPESDAAARRALSVKLGDALSSAGHGARGGAGLSRCGSRRPGRGRAGAAAPRRGAAPDQRAHRGGAAHPAGRPRAGGNEVGGQPAGRPPFDALPEAPRSRSRNPLSRARRLADPAGEARPGSTSAGPPRRE